MRRLLVTISLALSSGCLFAPPRPVDTGDGGTGDGGMDDGGGVRCIMPTDTANLPVVAVFDTYAGDPPMFAGDLLVRAGTDHDAPRVNFHEPGPEFSAVCATHSVELEPPESDVVVEVLAVGRMGDDHLLVLVSRNGRAAVHQINMKADPPTLTPTVITSNAMLDLASPFVAYNGHADEVWFGGGDIFVARDTDPFGGTAAKVTFDPSFPEEWYGAVGLDAANPPFAIVGRRADYLVNRFSMDAVTVATTSRGGGCDMSPIPDSCNERVWRAVTTGTVPFEGFSFVPNFDQAGEIAAFDVDAGAIPPTLTRSLVDLIPGRNTTLRDAALHSLGTNPTATDAVVLIRTTSPETSRVEWYRDVFSGVPAPTAMRDVEVYAERVVVGTFVPEQVPKILVLRNAPGQGGERCMEVRNVSELGDCN